MRESPVTALVAAPVRVGGCYTDPTVPRSRTGTIATERMIGRESSLMRAIWSRPLALAVRQGAVCQRYHQCMERSREVNPRVVVFDLGEVLATPTRLYESLAEVTGSDVLAIEAAYWSGRDAHDRGSSVEEYWRGVANALGSDASAGRLNRLSNIDSEAWVDIRSDAVALLRDLKEAGHTVAILSNAPAVLGEVARTAHWADYVDFWFFSGDLGIAKPDPEIYEFVSGTLSEPVRPIVFFDDRQINVDAARQAGWDAYLWTSGEDTRAVLERLAFL